MMPIDEMTLQETEHELRSYSPAAEFAADRSEAHRERRAWLWRRLDTLNQVGRRYHSRLRSRRYW